MSEPEFDEDYQEDENPNENIPQNPEEEEEIESHSRGEPEPKKEFASKKSKSHLSSGSSVTPKQKTPPNEEEQEETRQKLPYQRTRQSKDEEDGQKEGNTRRGSSEQTARVVRELDNLRHEKNLRIQALLDAVEQKDCEIYNLNMVVENLNAKLAHKDSLIARQLREIQSLSLEFNRYERDQINLTDKLELYEKKFRLFEAKIQEQVIELEERARIIERFSTEHGDEMDIVQNLTDSLKKSIQETEEQRRMVLDLTSEKNILLGIKEISQANITRNLERIEGLQKELTKKDIRINEIEMKQEQLYSDKKALEATLEEKEKLLMEVLNKYEATGCEAQGLRLSKVDQNNELITIREKYEQMRNKLVETQQENTELRYKLSAQEREIRTLEEIKRKLENRLEHTEKQNQAVENDIKLKNEKYGKVIDKLQTVQSKCLVLEQEVANKNTELDNLKREINNLNAECNLKAVELESLNQEAEKLQGEIKKLEVERRCVEDSLRLAEKDIQSKVKKSGNILAESEAVRSRINQIVRENENLVKCIEDLEKEKESILAESSELQAKLSTQKRETDHWKSEAESRVIETEKLSSGNASSSNALRDTQRSMDNLNLRLRESLTEIDRLNEIVKEMRRELEQREKAQNEAENDLKALARNYSAKDWELKEKTSQLKTLQKEHDDLLERSRKAERELPVCKSELENVRAKLEGESQIYKNLLGQREKKAEEWHRLYMDAIDQLNKMKTEKVSSISRVETIKPPQAMSTSQVSQSKFDTSSLDYSNLSEEETLTLLQDYKNRMSLMQKDMQELAMRVGVSHSGPEQ